MIRVTIDLLPGGDPSKARTIASARIANTSPDLPDVSDYVAEVKADGYPELGIEPVSLLMKISRWSRRQSVIALVGAVLTKASEHEEK
jgi:hypothetical protein